MDRVPAGVTSRVKSRVEWTCPLGVGRDQGDPALGRTSVLRTDNKLPTNTRGVHTPTSPRGTREHAHSSLWDGKTRVRSGCPQGTIWVSHSNVRLVVERVFLEGGGR